MLEIKNVSFQYEGNDTGRLENINLKINEGECVLLCGRSGCGKTTILRLINGLVPEYFDGKLTGDVLINNKKVSEFEMYERSRLIGSVFQNPRTQFFNVDTDSEIAFGMENLGLKRKDMKDRMEDLTHELNLQRLRGRSIFELSGGEKQRIAFASVYAMKPQIYLLDEPSANLDSDSIEELKKQLKIIKEQGKTIIVSEHRLYYLLEIADRIIYLDQGRIVEEYTKEEFLHIGEKERINLGLRSLTRNHIQINKNTEYEKEASDLVINHIRIKRRKKVIQEDVSFSANIGDIVGVIGENGVGKTTLLRTICGLHRDYSGQILLNGRACKYKVMTGMSYMVMQDVNYQLFADSVVKECQLGLKKADTQIIDNTLIRLSLMDVKHRHPNTLSGGQKQRVAVAVSQVCDKKILVFDEPTSGLDYDSMLQVAKLIKELAKYSIVFVVTHDIEFLNIVCTKTLELKKEVC